jgi:hypothetical protein
MAIRPAPRGYATVPAGWVWRTGARFDFFPNSGKRLGIGRDNAVHERRCPMAKSQDVKKDTKKKAQKSLKEKRADKKAKKDKS